MGLAVAFLPGIPGRHAPESAAQALYDAMIRLTGSAHMKNQHWLCAYRFLLHHQKALSRWRR